MTTNEVFVRCWSEHWNKPRFRYSRHAATVDGYYRRRIKPEFGDKPIKEVTHGAVRWWHNEMSDKPTEANRALEVLSRLFSFAEEKELLPLGSNPCRVVKAFPERQRERYATPEEIRRIGEVLESEKGKHPREVTFIYLLMLTGARPISLTRAKRSELVGNTLTFEGKSTTRTGQKEVLVFPESALRMLASLPKRSDGLLIGGPSPIRFWAKVREKANCKDLWVRDWRRTFATHALSSGVDLGVLGRLLNHRSTQTTWRYASLLPTKREEASQKIASGMMKLLESAP